MAAGKVSVLGAGAWGTALAKVLAEKGDDVVLWARNADVVTQVNERHENERYLPGAKLPESLRATTDLKEALDGSTMVVFVAPSHATREVAKLAAPFIGKDVPVVSATKGIENESLEFVDEVLAHELPKHTHEHFAFLSGPSFAKELANRTPTGVVIASKNSAVCEVVMRRFHQPYLRTYASEDVIGVECGGAMKNVVAIAAGACDGLGFGHNTRAALITRGLAEMTRLGTALGASPATFAGLAGLGDLVLTCTGALSRNRALGLELGAGKTLDDALQGKDSVAEGVLNTISARALAEREGVDMPIVQAVHRVLFESQPARLAIAELMTRELRAERD